MTELCRKLGHATLCRATFRFAVGISRRFQPNRGTLRGAFATMGTIAGFRMSCLVGEK